LSLIQKLKSLFAKSKKDVVATPEKPVTAAPLQPVAVHAKPPHHKPQHAHPRHKTPREHARRDASPRPVQRPVVAEPEKPKGKTFAELGLAPELIEKLRVNNFIHATMVQEKSIPAAIAGKNIFCSSETGSGKTLSFLLPMIHKFYTKEIDQALIICPTREIAIQIQKTLLTFDDPSLTSALVIGGTNVEMQKKALLEYPKILVATPGRLLDMLNTGLIWLNYTGYVVLDEADRMLDMGFEEDLIKIHSQLSGTQQTVLFSATLFPNIKKIAQRYASAYEEIVIGNPTSVAGSVTHVVVEMRDTDRWEALVYLIRQNPGKTMVFFNTIRETIHVTNQLHKAGFRTVTCIHSKIDQSERERRITGFRENQFTVLLGSDVASRGIDIPNVELVINFDLPNNSEEYIHRVGRTGRAGKTGIAIGFYSDRDTKKLDAIEKLIAGKIEHRKSYKGIL
jgi:superfamily II DNA/RNA helicase